MISRLGETERQKEVLFLKYLCDQCTSRQGAKVPIVLSNPTPLYAHADYSNSFPTAWTLQDAYVNLLKIPPLCPPHPQSPLSTSLENSCVHSRHLTGMEIRCKCHLFRHVSTCWRPGNLTGVCLSSDWTTFSSSLEKLLLGKQGGEGIVDVNCGMQPYFFFFLEDHYHLLVLWRLSVRTVGKKTHSTVTFT